MARRNNWKKKVEASIACNRIHVRLVRNALRDQKHRGLECVWYWTWDLAINKIVYTSESLSLAHQPRLTRTYFNRDGTECKKSRIPDFGIVRHAVKKTRQRDGKLRIDNVIWRLVAIAEIKPAPVDNSLSEVSNAVLDAREDLTEQVDILFGAYPEMESIVGISIAGDWWTFELFEKAGYPFGKTRSDSASYVPSSDRGTDGSSIPSSDRDELDIIGVDAPSSRDELDVIGLDENSDEEELSQHRHCQSEVDLTFYKLLDKSSDRAFVELVKLIRNLSGCEQFEGFPF